MKEEPKKIALYETADFYLAAFIIALGYRLVTWRRDDNNRKRLIFIFDLENNSAFKKKVEEFANETIKRCNQIKNTASLFDKTKNGVVDDEDFRVLFMNIGILDDYSTAQKTLKKIIHNDDQSTIAEIK